MTLERCLNPLPINEANNSYFIFYRNISIFIYIIIINNEYLYCVTRVVYVLVKTKITN